MKRSDRPIFRPKALFILPNLCAGGAERALITLMNNLDRGKFAPEFLALNENGPARGWIAPDIPVHSFGHRSIKTSILKLFFFIKTHKPDVIFTTMVHSNALALLMKIIFPRIRVVVREAALPSVLLSEYGIKGRLCRPVYKLLYPRADLVISNCSQMVDQFRNDLKIPVENHTILFNPVDVNAIKISDTNRFVNNYKNTDTLRFVCVGRLSYEKGYDRLIRALDIPEFKDKKWRLDIIGEGGYRPELEGIIKSHNMGAHVFLHGYNDTPWQYAALADCLLLPSRWEGMPNVVLEGFACGVPAIAMREAGGIVDIAAQADTQSITLADTMADFTAAMLDITPQNKTAPAPSILPECFTLPNIMRQFETCLWPDINKNQSLGAKTL
ncbi:MAG: glycosyltransferase [Bdellovibrionales bacterium]